jgi:hypothetical protein
LSYGKSFPFVILRERCDRRISFSGSTAFPGCAENPAQARKPGLPNLEILRWLKDDKYGQAVDGHTKKIYNNILIS